MKQKAQEEESRSSFSREEEENTLKTHSTRSVSRESPTHDRHKHRSGSRDRRYHRSGSRERRRDRSGSRERRRDRSGSRERRRDRHSSRRKRIRARSASSSRSRSRSRSKSRSRRHRRHHKRKSSRHHRSRRSRRSSSPKSRSPRDKDKLPKAAQLSGTETPSIAELMRQNPTSSLKDIMAKIKMSQTMPTIMGSNFFVEDEQHAREIYIGNLPPNIQSTQLQDFIGKMVEQVGLATEPGNPIMSTWISADGHYAFCEIRSVIECHRLLMMNGLSLMGQLLKVGRPKGYTGPRVPLPNIPARAATALTNLGCVPDMQWFLTGNDQDDNATKPLDQETAEPGILQESITIANLPPGLSSDQVQELVVPFGEIATFELRYGADKSPGKAVLKFSDPRVSEMAIEGLNGLDIGGAKLEVAFTSNGNGEIAKEKVENDTQSSVICLSNMVEEEELKNDQEYSELREDVQEECAKYGDIECLYIPRPDPMSTKAVVGVGQIFVHYKAPTDTMAAYNALKGKKFGENLVQVEFYRVEEFEALKC